MFIKSQSNRHRFNWLESDVYNIGSNFSCILLIFIIFFSSNCHKFSMNQSRASLLSLKKKKEKENCLWKSRQLRRRLNRIFCVWNNLNFLLFKNQNTHCFLCLSIRLVLGWFDFFVCFMSSTILFNSLSKLQSFRYKFYPNFHLFSIFLSFCSGILYRRRICY